MACGGDVQTSAGGVVVAQHLLIFPSNPGFRVSDQESVSSRCTQSHIPS